jgi:hypothetical protein
MSVLFWRSPARFFWLAGQLFGCVSMSAICSFLKADPAAGKLSFKPEEENGGTSQARPVPAQCKAFSDR